MYRTILLASCVITFIVLLISFPDQAIFASRRGLNIWFEIVFPSLLPFFVLAELFIALGVVNFFGTLLEPFMRPIFNVPGAGSFALIIGMASGYPVGAKICVRLREENQLTQIEAERLISFTNAASPLFIFGAISVGFFHKPEIGLVIALCHYISNLIVGVIMRFYKINTPTEKIKTSSKDQDKPILHRAVKNMHDARRKDGRMIGQLLGDALSSSIQTLIVIGGFIIIFSVLNELLLTIGLTALLSYLLNGILIVFQLPIDLNIPLIAGLFEITSGAERVSQLLHVDLVAQLIVISFMLGFNGFSVQAQVASLLTTTDIRFKTYFYARLIHGMLGSLLTLILYPFFHERQLVNLPQAIESFYQLTESYVFMSFDRLKQYGALFTLLCLALSIFIYSYKMVRPKKIK